MQDFIPLGVASSQTDKSALNGTLNNLSLKQVQWFQENQIRYSLPAAAESYDSSEVCDSGIMRYEYFNEARAKMTAIDCKVDGAMISGVANIRMGDNAWEIEYKNYKVTQTVDYLALLARWA